MRTATKIKHGTLRVWWVPQAPMEPFIVQVETLIEAKLILNALADYDQFQLDNKIKPDYSNAGGLSAYDAKHGEWIDWYSQAGDEIDAHTIEQVRDMYLKWEFAK